MTQDNFLKQYNAQHIIHPMAHPKDMLKNPPTVFCKAQDVFLYDIDGKKTLDAVGGLWNVNLGYSQDSIKQALTKQLDVLPYVSTFRGQSNDQAIILSKALIDLTQQEDMQGVFFTQGGSDSVDSALRLTRQYWKIQGKGEKFKFISLKQGYHGTHMGGASVNGNPQFRQAYEPLLSGCIHVSAPLLFRNPFGATDEDTLCDALLHELEQEIQFHGAHTIAGMIGEPILGAGGVIVPPKQYWNRVQALCKKYNIILIADEVITAFGRTGEMFGCRTFNYKPDMICFAKAITNGFFPFGGVLINKKMHSLFLENESALGSVAHGYTNSGNPVGCATALATLDAIKSLKPHNNAKVVGDYLKQGLQQALIKHENVGDIRGHGLMCSIECVKDKQTNTPDKNVASTIGKSCYQLGVWIRVSGPYIIISPPLIITKQHADMIIDAVTQSMDGIKQQ